MSDCVSKDDCGVGVYVFEVVISFPEEDLETGWIFMTADLGNLL